MFVKPYNYHNKNFWSKSYRKDTEHLYHAFMYSIVILLSGIYPFYAMLSLLVTIICYPCIIRKKARQNLEYKIDIYL